MLNKLVNIVLFQTGWFVSVLGAAHGQPWLGPLAAVPIVGVFMWQSLDRWDALRLVLFVGCVGAVLDSVLGYVGLFLYRENLPAPWVCPPWLFALWLIFATTLRLSLSWLIGRNGLTALLGGIFGPVSYYAGAALGAFSFGNTLVHALAIVGFLRALLLPLLLRFASQNSRVSCGPSR